ELLWYSERGGRAVGHAGGTRLSGKPGNLRWRHRLLDYVRFGPIPAGTRRGTAWRAMADPRRRVQAVCLLPLDAYFAGLLAFPGCLFGERGHSQGRRPWFSRANASLE